MEKDTNSKENGISLKLLLIVIILDGVIALTWANGYLKTNDKSKYDLIISIPEFLANISTFSAAIFGVEVVRKGIFNRGGSKYYPYKYGKRKLKDILHKYDNYADYKKVSYSVASLMEKNEYFKYVKVLLNDNVDFHKVWNDFNFYSTKTKLNDKEVEYFMKLRKYVFISVYNEYNKK